MLGISEWQNILQSDVYHKVYNMGKAEVSAKLFSIEPLAEQLSSTWAVYSHAVTPKFHFGFGNVCSHLVMVLLWLPMLSYSTSHKYPLASGRLYPQSAKQWLWLIFTLVQHSWQSYTKSFARNMHACMLLTLIGMLTQTCLCSACQDNYTHNIQ